LTPGRPSGTRRADRRAARAYLSKAAEFLYAAKQSYEVGNNAAAAGNAIHAADAIAASRAGVVWRGEHTQAAVHLETVGGTDGRQAARQLRRVLPRKNRAEYDPDPIPASKARTAVQAAERIVAIAERVVAAQS
jgi:HEPN domain-containing protein